MLESSPGGNLNFMSWGSIFLNQWGQVGNFHRQTGQYSYISDKAVKIDIVDLNQAHSLERILSITPRSYRMIADDDINNRCIGIVAQEIEEKIPYCLNKTAISEQSDHAKTSFFNVNYNDIFMHNVNATKEIYKIMIETTNEQNLQINSITDLYNSNKLIQQNNNNEQNECINTLTDKNIDLQNQINSLNADKIISDNKIISLENNLSLLHTLVSQIVNRLNTL